MLKLDDFKKLTKSQVLNVRFVTGGANATEYRQGNGQSGDDWKHDDGHVGYSRHVNRGGNERADP